jgi:exonuclease III
MIVSLNPWSVCNKTTSLSDFIIDHETDILCLTETWLTGSEKDDPIIAELVPNGYNIRHTPRESRGGGTAIIHRSSLNVHQTPLVTAMSEFSTFEYQECLLSGARTLRLCIVYRPPNNRSHTMGQFFEEFSNLMEVFSRSSP